MTAPADACAWSFGREDVYEIDAFAYDGPDGLRVRSGPADLGIGHCAAGAVWALVLPRGEAELHSEAAREPEPLAHVWIRLHPSELDGLFASETVRGPGDARRVWRMKRIADHKIFASFHAGRRALIPPPGTLIFDADTRGGVRRFFVVDRERDAAQYVGAFERQPAPGGVALSQERATALFDEVWQAFDAHYPGFVLRPEVDWDALREQYRPRVGEAGDLHELAYALAEMLAALRDLHIWIAVNDEPVPVYTRPRPANANPDATEAILGPLRRAGGDVLWTETDDRIGYILIPHWTRAVIPAVVDEILDQLRGARGLIVDVRLNGGGDERLAQQVAGRFAKAPVVYATSRVRAGPRRDELSEPRLRTLEPRGPWTFERPVIVLIGQRSMSSNESFAAMMGELPTVTLMGDRTAGSSGNPRVFEFEPGLRVSIPQWNDHRPDGEPLDGRGIDPDVAFDAGPEAFAGERDDLLQAALRRLRE